MSYTNVRGMRSHRYPLMGLGHGCGCGCGGSGACGGAKSALSGCGCGGGRLGDTEQQPSSSPAMAFLWGFIAAATVAGAAYALASPHRG